MATKITRQILEAYLNCKTKANLNLAGQQGHVSDDEALLISTRQEVRRRAMKGVMTSDVLREYLILLSVFQTCRYRGISFLRFLLSREVALVGFRDRKSLKVSRPPLEVQAQPDERGQRRRPVRHRRSMILAIPALLGVIYCAWSLHRTSFSILTGDSQWPRPCPYPDQWLVALNAWYDTRNPPPPDSIKLQAEWDRVRVTVALVLASCLWVLVISIVKLGVLGWLQKQR